MKSYLEETHELRSGENEGRQNGEQAGKIQYLEFSWEMVSRENCVHWSRINGTKRIFDLERTADSGSNIV